jgi:hypothetical protein
MLAERNGRAIQQQPLAFASGGISGAKLRSEMRRQQTVAGRATNYLRDNPVYRVERPEEPLDGLIRPEDPAAAKKADRAKHAADTGTVICRCWSNRRYLGNQHVFL